jgi:hypothetical protein
VAYGMTSQAQLNLMMMLHLMGWLDLPSVEWDVGLTRTERRKRVFLKKKA